MNLAGPWSNPANSTLTNFPSKPEEQTIRNFLTQPQTERT